MGKSMYHLQYSTQLYTADKYPDKELERTLFPVSIPQDGRGTSVAIQTHTKSQVPHPMARTEAGDGVALSPMGLVVYS